MKTGFFGLMIWLFWLRYSLKNMIQIFFFVKGFPLGKWKQKECSNSEDFFVVWNIICHLSSFGISVYILCWEFQIRIFFFFHWILFLFAYFLFYFDFFFSFTCFLTAAHFIFVVHWTKKKTPKILIKCKKSNRICLNDQRGNISVKKRWEIFRETIEKTYRALAVMVHHWITM